MNKPYMKKNEWNFLSSHLDENHIMLEYGSGNSTLHLAKKVKKLMSIEHDYTWYNHVLELTKEFDNIELILIEPNKPRTLPTKYEEFQDYINYIENVSLSFDRVLIDGRARQWCAEKILNRLNDNHIVFLHDFSEERPHYKSVLKYYDIIDSCESLVAMVKK